MTTLVQTINKKEGATVLKLLLSLVARKANKGIFKVLSDKMSNFFENYQQSLVIASINSASFIFLPIMLSNVTRKSAHLRIKPLRFIKKQNKLFEVVIENTDILRTIKKVLSHGNWALMY